MVTLNSQSPQVWPRPGGVAHAPAQATLLTIISKSNHKGAERTPPGKKLS